MVLLGRHSWRDGDAPALFAVAIAALVDVLEVPLAGVFEVDDAGTGLALRAGSGWTATSDGAIRAAFGESAAAVVREDILREDPSLARTPLLRDHGVVSLAAVPIHGDGRSSSWILVATRAPRTFGASEMGFLAAVGELLGAALTRIEAEAERTRQMAVLEEEAATARALLELGQTLHARIDDPYLLEWVNTAALRLLRCHWSAVLAWDQRRRVFRLSSNAGVLPVDLRIAVAEVQFRAAEIPRLRALRAGDLLEVPSLDDEPILPGELMQQLRLHAALCTPVSCGEEIVGILIYGWRDRSGPFRPRDRDLAMGIAHATAVALDTAVLVSELQMANRLKSEFLANMSHELRTPINVIAGYAEMLTDGAFGDVTSEAHNALARVHSNTRMLRDLVATTLHLGRLEAGRDAIDLETVDVGALLREVANETTASPAVTLHWPALAPALHVTTDRSKLLTIVQQLVQNAVKFTDAGTVTVAVEYDGRYLALTVRDTGIGIPGERLHDLFQSFRQLDGSNTRRHGGVGLGLHLVRRLVTLLRGDVHVESSLGAGSTFVVTLPASRTIAPD